jgi:RNA polymerase sigma-70 factor (sigma-E family)
MRRAHEAEYEAFVRAHRGRMMATARLLATGDTQLAEDLVQNALIRLYLAWSRARSGNSEAYARRVLVNCFVDHRRRPWVRRESTSDDIPESLVTAGELDDSVAAALLDALRDLPPRMRAAVVLRHVQDLSVDEAADALGCSVGTVKSQTARGLAKLRARLDEQLSTPGGNR